MKQTNALDFRKQLKMWMDGAKAEPLRITRKNGDAFVMVTQDEYEQTQRELAQLRGKYEGLLDAFHGRTEKASSQSLKSLFDEVKGSMKAKTKKVVG